MDPSPITVLCGGEHIQVVEEAKHFGLHVHIQIGLAASIAKSEQRFWTAWADLIEAWGYGKLQCEICNVYPFP